MSKVEAIEAAISELSSEERLQLAVDLPRVLPEIDGDGAWEKIIRSPVKRESFSKFVDEIEAQYKAGTLQVTEMTDEEFKRHS
jgi:hypothetical protein